MAQYDTDLNTDPEHGETPFGTMQDCSLDEQPGTGSRPPKPSDSIGTVGPEGPTSMTSSTLPDTKGDSDY